MSRVKILVACHKPCKVYHDEVYTPIHVGRSISAYGDEMADMIGDDTGEHISEKNPFYSELTAQYWGWKNLKDVDYIGLCHYRRYFQTQVTTENVDKLLGSQYDVMLVRPIYARNSVATRLRMATCNEDVYIFYKCLVKMYPEYKQMIEDFLKDNKVVPYNMFLMRKSLFDDFAQWQFSVLEEMEKYVKLPGYSRCRRLYGYVSEVMLPIYCMKNGLRVRYDDCVPMLGDVIESNRFSRWIHDLAMKVAYRVWKDDGLPEFDALLTGLKCDKIDL